MREMKFRAWSGEQMVSPDYIDRSGAAWWKENSIPTSSREVMQFTGLLDKNGKEIYEGDIVKNTKADPPEDCGFLCVFADCRFKFQNVNFIDDDEFGIGVEDYLYTAKCEIIGNIHQNPELI